MGQLQPTRYMDVSNTVDVSDPASVCLSVLSILDSSYPDFDSALLSRVFVDFERLYRGEFPGYRACDIGYHNSQHVLDVTLAMARLLDGYGRVHGSAGVLDAELALAGMVTALFHDSGYLLRDEEDRVENGAAYTRIHVSRGARLMEAYLPTVGLSRLVGICTRIVQFTGYEIDPSDLIVESEREHLLGSLLGTADLIAQMADMDYIRKCREELYEEFVSAGIAGGEDDAPAEELRYYNREHLLRSTPGFIRRSIEVRLDGYFNSVHRFAAEHFDGVHLYMDAIQYNCSKLEAILFAKDV
ncbi:MAG: hypothetical protein AAGA91_00910 [Pseudomonadota bacterium]